jgi:hypothetical protein
VGLLLRNRSNREIVVERLNQHGAVSVVHAGATASLHNLSVGVAKPIRLRPRESKRTSLLFVAFAGAPTALRLYDLKLDIPNAVLGARSASDPVK